MPRVFILCFLLLALSCADSHQLPHSTQASAQMQSDQAIRVEVYLSKASKERNCDSTAWFDEIRLQTKTVLVYNSYIEFETNGFADIQIDNIQSSQKMLILILAFDPQTDLLVSTACLDSVEVERNARRDLHVVLTPIQKVGDQNDSIARNNPD